MKTCVIVELNIKEIQDLIIGKAKTELARGENAGGQVVTFDIKDGKVASATVRFGSQITEA